MGISEYGSITERSMANTQALSLAHITVKKVLYFFKVRQ